MPRNEHRKKKSNPSKARPSGSATAPGPQQVPPSPAKAPLWMAYAFLFVSAFLLYGNTITHDYALDDAIVITENIYTQEGAAGLGKIFSTDAFEGYFKEKKNLVAGGRYRPLSIATFALEIEVFGQNPQVSHFINIVLYGLTGMVLFALLRMLLPGQREKAWWAGIPFLVALLFLAHPIHTEVVANIKGRDEILALLLSLCSMLCMIRWVETGRIGLLLVAVPLFFLALLSKETALPFLVVIPLTMWFFSGKSAQLSHYALVGAGLVLPIGLYLFLRGQVIGGLATGGTSSEILNDPFLYASFGERLATVSHTLGLYLLKFFVPLQLSHDYYFNQIPVIGWGRVEAILPAILYLGLLALTIRWTLKRHPAAYGMWWFFIHLFLVSNIVVTVGTSMGERFMYVPSLGLLFALVVLLGELGERWGRKGLLLPVAGVLALLFAIRTVVRNPVWKDNLTLFTTDAEVSPNSAKVRTAAGGALLDAATNPPLPPAPERDKMLDQSIRHLQAATRIYPEHGQAWLLLGNAWFNRDQQYGEALKCFRQAIAVRPGFADAYKNAAVTASKLKQYGLATAYYREAAALKPNDDGFWYEMGIAYEEWGKPDSAIYAFRRAVQVNPGNADALGKIAMVYGKFMQQYDLTIEYARKAIALKPTEEGFHENLGIAYAMKGDLNAAIKAFEEGLKTIPNSAKLNLNLGITYQNMGDTVRAQPYFQKAFALDPGLRQP